MGFLLQAMRRHPLGTYFLLAYLLTWASVFPLFAAAVGLTGRPIPAGLHALGAVGPVGAALAVTAAVAGREGVREFWGRLTRWRVGVGWWIVAIGSPVLFVGLAWLWLTVRGRADLDLSALRAALADPTWVGTQLGASLAYGVGEEPGWRGFALPRLQRGRSALRATLILTLWWIGWHVPTFFYRYQLGGPAGYLGFVVSLAAGAIWLTFLYNSTGGSVLIPIVWHTMWNAVSLAAMPVSSDLIAMASMIVVLAAAVAVVLGGPARLTWPAAAPGTLRDSSAGYPVR